PAAARTDDERRAVDAEIVEHRFRRTVCVVGRERLRRLPGLVLHEQGATTGAVVRGFRVLEPALLTVDVRHAAAGLGRRGGPRREAPGQTLDVELVEDARAPGLLETRDELRAQDVDLAVQETPLVRDLELLLREIVDQLLEVVVGERSEIREWLHRLPFVV